MNKFKIDESSIPKNIKFLNKEQVLDLISKLNTKEKPKTNINNNVNNNNTKSSKEDLQYNKEFNYIDFKNSVAHSYFYNTINLNNLERHIESLNKVNKNQITIEDFIVKVFILYNKKRQFQIH